MIDPSIRLRRAIHMKDGLLVRRIIQSNKSVIRNPDYAESSNTSLHLAAELGLTEIAAILLDAGHEANEVSLNTNFETPLMTAADKSNIDVGLLLISRSARCINWTNNKGMDALSIAASRPASAQLIPYLLNHPTNASDIHHRDNQGNTPLHHASAAGSLKALRILLEAGADASACNKHQWTPIAYSQTVQAEVYFKQLVAEINGLARTVTSESNDTPLGMASPAHTTGRERGDSRESATSGARLVAEQMPPKRRGGGVRLVTEDGGSGGSSTMERPGTADGVGGWSPRTDR